MRSILLVSVAALALSACEMRIGNDAPPVAENASAAGRAEDGKVTIEAPGFNLSINVPEGMGSRAEMNERGLVYPGARFAGIHVQAGREESPGRRDEVEMRLTSTDAPGQIAAWYRDPARAADFTVASATQEGAVAVISGVGRRDGERFTLRIATREGGSDLRLLLTDRN